MVNHYVQAMKEDNSDCRMNALLLGESVLQVLQLLHYVSVIVSVIFTALE